MNKESNRFLNAAIVIALFCGLLGVLGPLITIALENNAGSLLGQGQSAEVQKSVPRSFTEFGAVGDWLGGSSVPFLTLATLLIALATFREQRKEFNRVRKEAEDQNVALNLQRFENTYFLLQNEVQKRHDSKETYVMDYGSIASSEQFNTYEEFINTIKHYDSDVAYRPEENKPIQDLEKFKRAVRYRQILRGISFAGETKDLRLEHVRRLRQTIEKIFELFTIHRLPESTCRVYAELLKIQLSESAILAILYLSLEDFYRSDREYNNSVTRNFTQYGFYQNAALQGKKYLFETSSSDDDHLLFLFLTSLSERERKDFHEESMRLVPEKPTEAHPEE